MRNAVEEYHVIPTGETQAHQEHSNSRATGACVTGYELQSNVDIGTSHVKVLNSKSNEALKCVLQQGEERIV